MSRLNSFALAGLALAANTWAALADRDTLHPGVARYPFFASIASRRSRLSFGHSALRS